MGWKKLKGIVCGTCGYIALDGVAPDNCPVCMSPKEVFKEEGNAVNEPADPSNLSELDKKHLPVIGIVKKCGMIPEGCVDATVRVGEILHPTEPDHHIFFIDMYLDKEWITRVHLSDKVNPAAVIHLKPESSGKISVIELCNKHGKWISEVDL